MLEGEQFVFTGEPEVCGIVPLHDFSSNLKVHVFQGTGSEPDQPICDVV